MPEVPAPDYLTNSINIRLDDLIKELQVLIFERPDDEKSIMINNQYIHEWAKKDLSEVLGCLDGK